MLQAVFRACSIFLWERAGLCRIAVGVCKKCINSFYKVCLITQYKSSKKEIYNLVKLYN